MDSISGSIITEIGKSSLMNLSITLISLCYTLNLRFSDNLKFGVGWFCRRWAGNSKSKAFCRRTPDHGRSGFTKGTAFCRWATSQGRLGRNIPSGMNAWRHPDRQDLHPRMATEQFRHSSYRYKCTRPAPTVKLSSWIYLFKGLTHA